MFEKNMDTTNLSVSINGDLDSTSSAGTSSDHSAVHHDNISSPMAYGSLFLPNAGKPLLHIAKVLSVWMAKRTKKNYIHKIDIKLLKTGVNEALYKQLMPGTIVLCLNFFAEDYTFFRR